MTAAEKAAFVDAALKGDGGNSNGRWAFYQKDQNDLEWFQALAHMRGQQGRLNRRKKMVGLHMNPQTQLQSRHLKAKISESYQGQVWCVRVPTGAFFARRNDKMFITGNSGFPKSLNVSKAIDSMLGNDREVIRTESKADSTYHTQNVGECVVSTSEYEVTKAISPEAAQWEGWGTALKPAWEPFVVGRKPDASV